MDEDQERANQEVDAATSSSINQKSGALGQAQGQQFRPGNEPHGTNNGTLEALRILGAGQKYPLTNY